MRRPQESPLSEPQSTRPLVRALGRWDLAAITVNSTVGAGILGLPGRVYALVGPYSVLACLAGGVLMGLVAACYAEAASRFDGTGGTILYARAAFGRSAGFAAGWLAVTTRLFAYASILNLAVGYAAGVVPAIASPLWRLLAITLLSWGLGGIVYAGVGLSARANGFFTVAKLALLGGFVLTGAVILWPTRLGHLPPPPPAGHWAPAVVLLLFGLIGMDSAVVNGGEMRDPRRDVPFGLGVGMLAVVALYSGILLVCAGVVPNLAHSTRPVFDGTVAMLGPASGAVVACGAVLSMTGTLFTILFVGPAWCMRWPKPASCRARWHVSTHASAPRGPPCCCIPRWPGGWPSPAPSSARSPPAHSPASCSTRSPPPRSPPCAGAA